MEFAQLVRRPVRPRRNDQPTPSWEPAVLCLGPAAGTFGLAFAAGLQGNALAVWPISIALLGVLLTVRRRIEAARLRAAADEWIARGWEGPAARYAWRIEELTSPRERKVLGGSIRSVVRELEARRPAIGSLVNRRALYPHRRLLVALADRLAATAGPCRPRGCSRCSTCSLSLTVLFMRVPVLTAGRVTPAPRSARFSTAWRCVTDV
jgi:hypothetical protein